MSNFLKRKFSNLKNLNKYSKVLTEFKERGAAQAMLYSLKFKNNNITNPMAGICSMWYEGNPCNTKLNQLSNIVKKSVNNENINPIQFNTIGISDGISMGTFGMKYSLPSRELIADSIESVVMAHHYDSLITIPGCDKNLPGSLIGMLRVNRPSFMIYGGSMKPIIYKNYGKLDIISAFESYGKYINGLLDNNERIDIIKNSCDSKNCGSCSGMYTANTMAMCLEVMGITLPNSSSNASMSKEKLLECKNSGKILHNLMTNNIKPSDIITKDSVLNAIKMLYISGGSTNAVIHLLAISKTINLNISLNDFKDYENIPVLLNMKPHGDNLMYDLYNYGGTSILIKYLIENDILNGDILTITGNTLYENVKDFKEIDFNNQNIIYPLDNPFKNESHIKILGGNLAPNNCISKVYDTNEKFRGKALVYENENDMINDLKKHKIKKDNFIIIRNQGESVGCPEMLAPTSALVGYFGTKTPPLATDGRFSGGSKGILIAHLSDSFKKNSPTTFVKNGDIIEIDLNKNEINVIDDKFLERGYNLKKNNNIEKFDFPTYYLKKFSKNVGELEDGYLSKL